MPRRPASRPVLARGRATALLALLALTMASLLPGGAAALEAPANLPEPPDTPELGVAPDAPNLPTELDLPGELPDVPLPALPDAPALFCQPLDDVEYCRQALAYQLLTTYDAPDGTVIERTHDATVGVPLSVDVDGVPGPELVVQFQIDAGRATMRATKLASAPDVLPLQVEAVLADPRGVSDWRLGFGYDTRHASAPGVYEGTVTLTGAGRAVGTVILDVRTAGAGERLAVVGGVFQLGADGRRIDPRRARVDFSPVPTLTTVTLNSGDVALGQMGLTVVSNVPTTAGVTAESVDGADALTLGMLVDRLPNTLVVTVATSPSGQRTLDYSASARIDLVRAEVRESSAGALRHETVLQLDDVPRAMTLVQDSPTRARFQADSPLGALTVGYADGPAVFLDEPAYAHATDAAGYDSLAVRIPGMSAAEVDTGDRLLLDLTLDEPVPLHVLVEDGDAEIDAWVRDLPNRARLSFDAASGAIDYQGSAVIGELTVDATDPAGLSGRATALELRIEDIPTALSMVLAQSGDTVLLDAKGKVVGLIELLLTSGPDRRLPADVDGVLLHDHADAYVAFARITGLKRLKAVAGPPPSLEIDTNAARVLRVEMQEDNGGKRETTTITLDHLVPNVKLALQDTAAGQVITYSASRATKSLTFDSNAGDRWRLTASVADPLPASLRVCQASNRSCGGSGRTANAGSVTISASEHTTLHLFDCVRPLNATCTRANATRNSSLTFTRVDNLRLKHLVLDAHANDAGYSGHIYLDTDNATMTGSLLNRDAGGGGFSANFPAGFKSQNRLGTWTVWGLSKDKSGSISCPGGTGLDVRVLSLWIGVKSYLC